MQRKRGKVIRNFTEKTASQSVLKATERMQRLNAENQRLRSLVSECISLLEAGTPLGTPEWSVLRQAMQEAIQSTATS